MKREIVEVKNVSKFYNVDKICEKGGDVDWRYMIKSLINPRHNNTNSEDFCALRNINLSILKGESLGIIGLNGSGKTTLLQIIAGTKKASEGKVYMKGKVAAILDLGSSFDLDFSGRDNIYIYSGILGISNEECTSKFEKIVKFSELEDFIDQPLRIYSSGMILRLAFAVIVFSDPDILIIDEALAVGDVKFQLKCFRFLEDFKKNNGTLILVSHDLNSVARLCDKSILLEKGVIKSHGKTINIINEFSIDVDKKDLIIHEKRNVELVSTLEKGGKKGRIINYNINSNRKNNFETGKITKVNLKIKSFSNISNPIFAIRIRNSKGQEVYGTNTKLLKTVTPDLKINDELNINFYIKLNLVPDEYYISLGFTHYEEGELIVIHRIRECIKFNIISSQDFFGISNCFARCEIKNEN